MTNRRDEHYFGVSVVRVRVGGHRIRAIRFGVFCHCTVRSRVRLFERSTMLFELEQVGRSENYSTHASESDAPYSRAVDAVVGKSPDDDMVVVRIFHGT